MHFLHLTFDLVLLGSQGLLFLDSSGGINSIAGPDAVDDTQIDFTAFLSLPFAFGFLIALLALHCIGCFACLVR